MSKPGKVLKGLCKKLGVRLTVKRGKKRVYKSIAVLKKQCANKKKRKVKRKRKFGSTQHAMFKKPMKIKCRNLNEHDCKQRKDCDWRRRSGRVKGTRGSRYTCWNREVSETIPMSAKQRIKKVSVQTGIPYKQLLMYVLGAGALGGGAYVGHRYYKKRKKPNKKKRKVKKKVKRKRKFGSQSSQETQRQEAGNTVPSSPEVFVEEEEPIHGYALLRCQHPNCNDPSCYGGCEHSMLELESYSPAVSGIDDNDYFEEAQRRSLSPSPSPDDNNDKLRRLDETRKRKRDAEKGNRSGFDPDGASSRNLSTTFEQVSKRQKMLDAAEKRRIYNLITKAVKDNEALNNVLQQRESNKKIPMINEIENFNASSREVLQSLEGNYRYNGPDGLDRETTYGFIEIDWNTNSVILGSGSEDVRMTFQYFLENFSKMNNNFGKRKRKKTKRKRKVKKKVKRNFGRQVAKRSNEKLWRSIQQKYYKSNKGGKPGQWSARKAQLAVQEYKKKGGKYVGNNRKKTDLHKWTKEDWGTRSGKNSIQGKKATGERYLPRKAREALTKKEYKRTTAAKRRGIKKGKQFVRQPKKIAKKTAKYRRRKKVKRKRRFGKTPFIVPGKKLYDNLDNSTKIVIDDLYYQLEQLVKQDNFTEDECDKLHDIIVDIETFHRSLVPDIAYTTWNANCSYI